VKGRVALIRRTFSLHVPSLNREPVMIRDCRNINFLIQFRSYGCHGLNSPSTKCSEDVMGMLNSDSTQEFRSGNGR